MILIAACKKYTFVVPFNRPSIILYHRYGFTWLLFFGGTVSTVLKVVGGIFALIVFGTWLTTIGLKDIREMTIDDVDLHTVQDGVYTGSFKKARWKNDVEVTVKNHHIIDIKNTNKLPPPNRKIVDKAINAMLAKQSVVIDVISGASVNTRAFQKAVENALSGRAKK